MDPQVKNKTKQTICLTGPSKGTATGGVAFPIKPGQSKRVPRLIWDHCLNKRHVQAMLNEGGLVEIHEPKARESAPAPKPEPAADDGAGKPFADMHWKQAKKHIEASDDSDYLLGLLEGEDRKKVKEMLEQRLEELTA
jgi:hypothetical protein